MCLKPLPARDMAPEVSCKEIIKPGAILAFPLYRMKVVDVGQQPHQQGYGDTDIRVIIIGGCKEKPGTLINTPFGVSEVVSPEYRGAIKI